ncbi:MAG: hypothetical protein ACF8TS_06310 [Maioricimonas sp. JB049]
MKALIAAGLLAVLIVPAVWLQAQQASPPQRDRPADRNVTPRPDVPRRPPVSRGRDREVHAPLPADLKSLELEFVVLDEHARAVAVAGGTFSASTDLAGAEGEMHIRIDGGLQPLPDRDRWLLSFETTMHRNDL